MERKKATDFPQELLNLFDLYVHGDIDRRAFLMAPRSSLQAALRPRPCGRPSGQITLSRTKSRKMTSESRPAMKLCHRPKATEA